jgi:hypothetical protein
VTQCHQPAELLLAQLAPALDKLALKIAQVRHGAAEGMAAQQQELGKYLP